jgi:hypothetical protein
MYTLRQGNPCDEETQEYDCTDCTQELPFILRQCEASCTDGGYCKRSVRHASGKCWQHRNTVERSLPSNMFNRSTQLTKCELVGKLLAYVKKNSLKVIVFDYDLTASKIHLGGWGSFNVHVTDTEQNIQMKQASFVQKQSGNITLSFIIAMHELHSHGYKLAIATMSDETHNGTFTRKDGSIDIVYTGKPFVDDVMKIIFPSFYKSIFVVGQFRENKKDHIQKIATHFDVPFNSCLLIDDSLKNIQDVKYGIHVKGSMGFGSLEYILYRTSIAYLMMKFEGLHPYANYLDIVPVRNLIINEKQMSNIYIRSLEDLNTIRTTEIDFLQYEIDVRNKAKEYHLNKYVKDVEKEDFQLSLLKSLEQKNRPETDTFAIKIYLSVSMMEHMGYLFDSSDSVKRFFQQVNYKQNTACIRRSLQKVALSESVLYTIQMSNGNQYRILHVVGYGLYNISNNYPFNSTTVHHYKDQPLFVSLGDILLYLNVQHLGTANMSTLRIYQEHNTELSTFF